MCVCACVRVRGSVCECECARSSDAVPLQMLTEYDQYGFHLVGYFSKVCVGDILREKRTCLRVRMCACV